MSVIKIAVAQHPCRAEMSWNIEQGKQAARQAAAGEADLLLLPELHAWHYFCIHKDPAWFDTAVSIPGTFTDALGDIAREHKLVLVTTVFEQAAEDTWYNTAVVFDHDGSLAGCYRKMHIPDDPGYYEKFYFTAGEQGFVPLQTSLCRLGILICWDQWFPEAARLQALAGAELLLFPSAIGWDLRDPVAERQRQLSAWQTVQRGHAIANILPVAVSNRVGVQTAPAASDMQTDFWGGSFIAGQQGELLAVADNRSSALITASVDLSRTESVRRVWTFFRDRRPDCYHALVKNKSGKNC